MASIELTDCSVNPLTTLVEEILPSFAADARDLVSKVMALAKSRGEEVPIQDGFDLYKELVHIRGVHAQALPRSVNRLRQKVPC